MQKAAMAITALLGVAAVVVAATLPSGPAGTDAGSGQSPGEDEIRGSTMRGFAMLTNATSSISVTAGLVLPPGHLSWQAEAYGEVEIQTGHTNGASGHMLCQGDFGGIPTTFKMPWAPSDSQRQVYSSVTILQPRQSPKMFEAGAPVDFTVSVTCDVTMTRSTEGYVAVAVKPILLPVK